MGPRIQPWPHFYSDTKSNQKRFVIPDSVRDDSDYLIGVSIVACGVADADIRNDGHDLARCRAGFRKVQFIRSMIRQTTMAIKSTGTTEASVMRCTCTFTYIARKEKTVWKRLFGLALFRG